MASNQIEVRQLDNQPTAPYEHVETSAISMGRSLSTCMPTGWKFVLLMACADRPDSISYTSNMSKCSALEVLMATTDALQSENIDTAYEEGFEEIDTDG